MAVGHEEDRIEHQADDVGKWEGYACNIVSNCGKDRTLGGPFFLALGRHELHRIIEDTKRKHDGLDCEAAEGQIPKKPPESLGTLQKLCRWIEHVPMPLIDVPTEASKVEQHSDSS